MFGGYIGGVKVLEYDGNLGYSEIWKSVLRYVYNRGEIVHVYDYKKGKRSGGETLEVQDLIVVINDPPKPKDEDVNMISMIGERFIDNMLILPGSYQYKRIVEDQLPLIEDRIKENKHTRNAVFVVHYPDELKHEYKTCTIGGQFMIRDDKMSLRVFMRSCDLVNGFPGNVIGYVGLLYNVAERLGYKVDRYIHYMSSAHIYRIDMDKVLEMIS